MSISDNIVSASQKGGSFGVVKTDDRFDEKNLSEIENEVVSCEDFVVFGKASIEQFDDDTTSQKVKMEAFEESLPQFFSQGGLISYGHKDVKVGEALKSYTLENPTTVEIDGEKHSFEAGETLRTEVTGDTLWLCAHIYGKQDDACTDASIMTRLGAFKGELDGFSVTFKAKKLRETSKGQVIEAIDWHSTTIGTGDTIKNPGSEFGVAEFKMWEKFNIDTKLMESKILRALFNKSSNAMTEEVLAHTLSETQDFEASAKALAEDEDYEAIEAKARDQLANFEEKADSREDLVAMVAEMTGLSPSEVNDALEDMLGDDDKSTDEVDEEVEQEGDYEDEDEPEEEKADEMDEHVEAIADSMDVPVSQVMEVLSAVGDDEEEVADEKAEESTETDDADVAEKSEESDESADASEIETESKSEEVPSDEDEPSLEETVEQVVDEKLDGLDERVQSQVEDSLNNVFEEKMFTGDTPEQDETPAEEGTTNLLDSW